MKKIKQFLYLLCICMAVTGLAHKAHAQSANDGFDPNANEVINDIAVQSDGKVLIGGYFTTISSVTRNHIARLNVNGSLDTTFDPNANDTVSTVSTQSDGKILIGGYFTKVGDTDRGHIARLNSDGSLDMSFNTNANDTVRAIAVQSDGKILIGGSFTNISGVIRNRIARLNADGSLDDGFNPNSNGVVSVIVMQPDGKILIGGYFSTVGGVTRNYIARLHSNGSLDTSFDPDADNIIFAISIQSDGKILVSGVFTQIGGVVRNRIARLNSDGSLDADFNPDADNMIFAIGIQSDGKILVGGYLTQIGGITRNRIARLNSDGSLDAGFNPDADNIIYTIGIQSDSKILIGGYFSKVSGVTRNYIARLYPSGRVDRTMNISLSNKPGFGSPAIRAIATQPDGKLIIGGYFTNISSTTKYSRRLVRIHEDGVIEESFNPEPNNTVFSTLVQPDGKIIIGGNFTVVGGTTRTCLARLNSDGSLDTSFDPNVTGGFVSAMVIQPDGKIIISGNFSSVGGVARSGIARLNSDGSLDAAFVSNPNLTIYAIALPSDGKIIIGGFFTNVDGVTRNHIARLNSDGSLDTSFDPNVGGWDVSAIAIQPDGKIIIGGEISMISGTTRNLLARLNSDGSLDADFDPTINNGSNYSVNSIEIQSDGKILICGYFTTVGGTALNGFARLNSDGSLDTGFDLNINNGSSYTVDVMAQQADGKIAISGYFANNGWKLVRLTNTGAVLQDFEIEGAIGSQIIRWIRKGPGMELNHVRFETSTDGATWTLLGNGVHITDGWELIGANVSLETNIYLRARGFAQGGHDNTSTTLIESVKYVYLASADFSVTKAGTGSGLVSSAPAGISCGSTCSNTFVHGTSLTLTATPSPDSVFSGWSGDADCSDGVVTVENATTCTATFTQMSYMVTPSAGLNGTISPDTAQTIIQSHTTSFTITPAAGYHILSVTGCGGSLAGNIYTTAPIMGDCTVTATFGKQLAVNKTGTGTGSVTSAPVGINCGTECSKIYDSGASVTLTATPSPDSVFSGWSGDVDCSDGSITLDIDKTCTATFTLKTYSVTPSAGPNGSISPDTLQTISYGQTASFIVTPATEYHIASISGCNGSLTGNTYTTGPVMADCTVSVTFEINTYPLTVSKTGTGQGTITSVPAGINCSSDCSETYAYGTSVTLTATAPADTKFNGWSGACTGTAACEMTIDMAKAVTANFSQIIKINSGDTGTSKTAATLTINNPGATQMRFMFNVTAWTAWEPYANVKSITLPAGDGVKTVYVQFNNDTKIYSDTIILDTKLPVGTIVINNGDAVTADGVVTVTLTAADDSDITEMCISTTSACTAWESFKPTKMVYLNASPVTMVVSYGIKYVYARFKDRAGKISLPVSDSIRYSDPEHMPVSYVNDGAIVINDNWTYTTTTTVKAKITNPAPGVYTHMCFSTDGLNGTAWEPVKPEKTIYLPSGDGKKIVYVLFANLTTGALSEISGDEIILDTKAPVGAVIINNGAISTNDVNITVNIEATDVNGVSKMMYSLDGITWPAVWDDYATTKAITLTGVDSTKKVSFKFKDNAGKISAIISDSILLDRTAPAGKVLINAGAATTTSDLVTLTLTAPTSVFMQISVDGGTMWDAWEPFVRSKKVTLPSGAGTKTVAVKFRDYTGNESTEAIDTINRQ